MKDPSGAAVPSNLVLYVPARPAIVPVQVAAPEKFPLPSAWNTPAMVALQVEFSKPVSVATAVDVKNVLPAACLTMLKDVKTVSSEPVPRSTPPAARAGAAKPADSAHTSAGTKMSLCMVMDRSFPNAPA
jgi:hypothetical protein